MGFVSNNSVDVARLLLDRGANIEHQSNHGVTALFLAWLASSVEVVRLLLDRGANMEHQDKEGRTAFVLGVATK
jgi:ankyrin repeat protein